MQRPAPSSPWVFPSMLLLPDGEDLAAVGADLEAGTLLSGYRAGYFPMPLRPRELGWFCPDPRGVLMPGELIVSRSLRRSARRYRISTNQAFDKVIRACGDPARPHGWIDTNIVRAYSRLHHLGWAHSVEVWDDDGLAGGLYGVRIGGLFAGESMFHRRTDASKVALLALTELLGDRPDSLIDVQWETPHLATLGVRSISRRRYAQLLPAALALDPAEGFDSPPTPPL